MKPPPTPAAKPRGKPRNQARGAPPGDRLDRQAPARQAPVHDSIAHLRRDRRGSREEDHHPRGRWRWLAAAVIVAMLAWPPLLRWAGNLGRDALALGKAASASRAIENLPTSAWADWTPREAERPAFSPDSLIRPVAFTASPALTPTPPAEAVGQHLTLQNISTIRVGQRVAGSNPLEADTDYAWSEPEPSGWRKLRLLLVKESGKRLDIELLRPLDWIKRSEAAAGVVLWLDMPELGATGPALVLSVEACPAVSKGFGHVVTGTFAHEPDAPLVNVLIEGQSQPIGATDNHPFWSEDRHEFVEAGRLRPRAWTRRTPTSARMVRRGVAARGRRRPRTPTMPRFCTYLGEAPPRSSTASLRRRAIPTS